MLDTSQILAEISQMLIAGRPHICLETCFQLASHTTHYDRWELNYFLRVGIFILITGSLEVYDHEILKFLKLLSGVTLSEHISWNILKLVLDRIRIKVALKSIHWALVHFGRVKMAGCPGVVLMVISRFTVKFIGRLQKLTAKTAVRFRNIPSWMSTRIIF